METITDLGGSRRERNGDLRRGAASGEWDGDGTEMEINLLNFLTLVFREMEIASVAAHNSMSSVLRT